MNRYRGAERRGAAGSRDDLAAILKSLEQERARTTALEAQVSRLSGGAEIAEAGATLKAKRKTRGEIEAERDAVAKEKFHSLHTFLLAPANMLSQMTCAAIFLDPGPLLSSPEWAEGVRFFVYGAWGYAVPAVWLVCFHWRMLSRDIRASIAWIVICVIGIGGLLAWFDQ